MIKGVSEAPLNIRGVRVENHFQAGIKIVKPDKLGSYVQCYLDYIFFFESKTKEGMNIRKMDGFSNNKNV